VHKCKKQAKDKQKVPNTPKKKYTSYPAEQVQHQHQTYKSEKSLIENQPEELPTKKKNLNQTKKLENEKKTPLF
jgi:hypothetical protein